MYLLYISIYLYIGTYLSPLLMFLTLFWIIYWIAALRIYSLRVYHAQKRAEFPRYPLDCTTKPQKVHLHFS